MEDFDQFMRDTASMFDRVEDQVEKIHHIFILKAAWRVIDTTPGFGNQEPSDTPYVPTGRLRGGWNLQSQPGGETSKGLSAGRNEDGPFSDYGIETYARIKSQLDRITLKGEVYLVNDIAYGYLIHWQMGRHTAERRWVEETVNFGQTFLDEAREEVMR